MFKHAKKSLAFLTFASLLLSVVFLTKCNEAPPSGPVGGSHQFSKFSLPAGAALVSGTLYIYEEVGNNPDPRTINIYRNLGDWDETTVNWANRPAYDLTVEGTFSTDGAPVWKMVNITGLVQKWFNCEPNYGLLLDQLEETPNQSYALYSSKEGTNPEYLEIVYSIGGVNQPPVQVPAIADAYIWCGASSGNTAHLETGYVNGCEKQSLIKFDVEPTLGGGCTLTPGYWKTHSEFGPAPYDDTWAQLPNGASTIFFLSEKTYYQVLWTSPGGNAYYNLSFHYIAAGLNFMNGADPSAAQAAYDAATILFNTYTPAQIKALKGSNPLRQQFISLAGILGNYNEGIIGPGHCD